MAQGMRQRVVSDRSGTGRARGRRRPTGRAAQALGLLVALAIVVPGTQTGASGAGAPILFGASVSLSADLAARPDIRAACMWGEA